MIFFTLGGLFRGAQPLLELTNWITILRTHPDTQSVEQNIQLFNLLTNGALGRSLDEVGGDAERELREARSDWARAGGLFLFLAILLMSLFSYLSRGEGLDRRFFLPGTLLLSAAMLIFSAARSMDGDIRSELGPAAAGLLTSGFYTWFGIASLSGVVLAGLGLACRFGSARRGSSRSTHAQESRSRSTSSP